MYIIDHICVKLSYMSSSLARSKLERLKEVDQASGFWWKMLIWYEWWITCSNEIQRSWEELWQPNASCKLHRHALAHKLPFKKMVVPSCLNHFSFPLSSHPQIAHTLVPIAPSSWERPAHKKLQRLQLSGHCWVLTGWSVYIWVFPKIVVPPNHPF